MSHRVLGAQWWAHGSNRWLQVQTTSKRGGMTDAMTAREHVGPSSWEHGEHSYLAEHDAMKWLESVGHSEADISTRHMGRPPSGYRSVRDEGAAAVVKGHDTDAINDYFAKMEKGRWD